jgi:uncharacterized protein YbbC (DUF1343 family)/CubicO group peptidase (beta-lactamase class C family)
MRPIETCVLESLRCAVERSGAPGAVACIGHRDAVVATFAHGHAQITPTRRKADTDTLYDLASLTKVVATTTAVLLLMEDGAFTLDTPLTRYLPHARFEGITLRHLLTHSAGLTGHAPFYEEVRGANEMIARIAALEPGPAPGTQRVYSDFGFILLARVVEMAAGKSFDAFCTRRIFAPLGMKDTAFNPAPERAARAAATEQCAWRGRMLVGEVHDENAFAMGGVSGHAGLFSTAGDLAKFCTALLSSMLLKESTLDMMLTPHHTQGYRWQGLGWKLDGWMLGNEGYLPSRHSFGHTGWTGTSMWLCRETRRYAILLSNTCHPSRDRRDNVSLRQTLHVPVSRMWFPQRSNVQTGLDRAVMEGCNAVRGRVGLLTNTAAVDVAGRWIVDLFRDAPGVKLQRLFSPEHGLRMQAEAGAKVSGERGEVEVVSLYGDLDAPTAAHLADLDHFVIDLPDIGARYYTYAYTMHECIKACSAAGVPVTVIDRPNPLGGVALEGPVAQMYGSKVCAAPVPVRHGMTLGELALFMHRRLQGSAQPPRVIECDNWPRELMWWNSGMPWRAPSPNIADADTALLYIGQCLLEGTNLNEGRGTVQPFKRCGAPWIDEARLLKALAKDYTTGIAVESAVYTPRAIPGRAANPVHKDRECRGISLALFDREAARPFMVTVALLHALHEVHGDALQYNPFFDTLAGGPWLREQLQRGAALKDIAQACEEQCRGFALQQMRLYRDSRELTLAFLC